LHARDPARERRLHEAAARYLVEVGQTSAAARHLLAADQQAAALSLLSDGVVRDVLTNPIVGSALDVDEIRPELFAGAPEFLLPLAAELLWRGAFERGSQAVALAGQNSIDPGQQPELAVRLALVNMLHCTFIGQFDEALAHREWARPFEANADGAGDWIVTLDTLAMYCHTYVGQFSKARQLAKALAAAQVSAPLTEVLCPGVISQAALIEGGSPRSWHTGRKHPRRCPPPPLRPPLFQLPRDTDNSPARSGTARSGRRRRARRTRTGDGQRRPACLQLPCPARPGPDLGSRRPLDEALSSLPAVPS
jgi:hypothetical protein